MDTWTITINPRDWTLMQALVLYDYIKTNSFISQIFLDQHIEYTNSSEMTLNTFTLQGKDNKQEVIDRINSYIKTTGLSTPSIMTATIEFCNEINQYKLTSKFIPV